jgi:hypothetical protein
VTEHRSGAGLPAVTDFSRLGQELVCPNCWREIEIDATACGSCGRKFPGNYRCAENCTECCGRGGLPLPNAPGALELCRSCGGHGHFLLDSAVPLLPCPECGGRGRTQAWWWRPRQFIVWVVGPINYLAAIFLLPTLATKGNQTMVDWAIGALIIATGLFHAWLIGRRSQYARCGTCTGKGCVRGRAPEPDPRKYRI